MGSLREEAEADAGWPALIEFLNIAGLKDAQLERALTLFARPAAAAVTASAVTAGVVLTADAVTAVTAGAVTASAVTAGVVLTADAATAVTADAGTTAAVTVGADAFRERRHAQKS